MAVAIYSSWFTYEQMWLAIVMLVYQRENNNISPGPVPRFGTHWRTSASEVCMLSCMALKRASACGDLVFTRRMKRQVGISSKKNMGCFMEISMKYPWNRDIIEISNDILIFLFHWICFFNHGFLVMRCNVRTTHDQRSHTHGFCIFFSAHLLFGFIYDFITLSSWVNL